MAKSGERFFTKHLVQYCAGADRDCMARPVGIPSLPGLSMPVAGAGARMSPTALRVPADFSFSIHAGPYGRKGQENLA